MAIEEARTGSFSQADGGADPGQKYRVQMGLRVGSCYDTVTGARVQSAALLLAGPGLVCSRVPLRGFELSKAR